MKLKYTVEQEHDRIDFHFEENTGSLLIRTMGEEEIEIPHKTAVELIEILRSKLYEHQEQSESLWKKIWK